MSLISFRHDYHLTCHRYSLMLLSPVLASKIQSGKHIFDNSITILDCTDQSLIPFTILLRYLYTNKLLVNSQTINPFMDLLQSLKIRPSFIQQIQRHCLENLEFDSKPIIFRPKTCTFSIF